MIQRTNDRECCVCGKMIYNVSEEWAYKSGLRDSKPTMWFCSWHCMREAERNPGKYSGKKKGVTTITIDSETHTVAEWCEIKGVKVNTAWTRIRAGRDPFTPAKRGRKKKKGSKCN